MPPEPRRHPRAAAAAYTVLPLALLLALVAWALPLITRHHPVHRPPSTGPSATTTAPTHP
ncbi:hypothetical protein OH807_32160 [Kitasatospora sp. NBC_01560]|uniref:hypothetical protein n=1 Tax=Kitasatospora sp. NBC_01560 TaxID=2975965 RepID=UPI003866BD22